MDLFSKAKESFSMAGKEFTQKATDVSGIARVNLKLKEEKSRLNEAICNLGELLLNEHPDEASKMFPEQVFAIRELQKAIEQDKKELAVFKGMQICPNCGAEQEKTAVVCTVCHMNIEEAKRLLQPQEEPVRFCKNCGTPLSAGAKFCANCGSSVK